MPHPHDFAGDAVAVANRRRKAEILVRCAVWLGATDLADLEDPDVQHTVLAHARRHHGITGASVQTWRVARAVRTETVVHRLAPGEDASTVRCGCTPHPVTRVLFESLVTDPATAETVGGWPCPHPDPHLAPPAAPDDVDGGWGEVGLDDGSEPDWPSLRTWPYLLGDQADT